MSLRQIPFPPASALFAGIDALLDVCPFIFFKQVPSHVVSQAASGVTSSYDALLDLFDCLGNFLKRLEIYTAIPPTPIMTDIIVKIIVELLSVLALATKQIKQGRFSKCDATYPLPVAYSATEKFAKKLLGDSEIETVLQRLDRSTDDEARMTVAQTMGVVYGLVGNMKIVMEGAESFASLIIDILLRIRSVRWKGIDGQYSAGFRYACHAKYVSPC